MRFILCSIILSCSVLIMPSITHAQLNVKIGYIPALGNFNSINSILDEYNANNTDIIETPFASLNFMHGIDVGFRYKIGSLAFDVDWSILNRDRDALLYFSQSDSFSSRLYKLSLSSFSFGADSYFGRFGLGAAIHSQKLNIRREIGSNDLNLVSDRNWAMDFHLNFVLQSSNKVSVVAKPYYRYSLEDYDLNSFSNDLNNSNVSKGDLFFYGLSLFFYNGRK